jgi:serine/threonine-protein kinase
MSPEQATAEKEITARSDIYSIASVLYEMLAGQPPHIGGAAQQIIMKIITEQALPVRALRKSVPLNVDAALARALEKVPADRFASAAEFAAALGNVTYTDAKYAGAGAGAAGRGSVSRAVFAATAVVAVIAVAALAWTMTRPKAEAGMAAAVRFLLEPPPEGFATGRGITPAISPDGRHIAFIGREKGKRLIFVRDVGQTTARALPGTENIDHMAFSPDGAWIAFQGGIRGAISKAAVDGSAVVPVGELRAIGQAGSPNGIAWIGDQIVASLGNRLYRVPASGGALDRFLKADSNSTAANGNLPVGLRDRKTVLYTDGRLNVYAASLLDGSSREIGLQAARVFGVVDGLLVYATDRGLVMAARFDESALKVVSAPEPIESHLQTGPRWDVRAALSPSGVFAMMGGDNGSRLVLRDVAGVARPLLETPQDYGFPRYSPDGRKVAYSVGGNGGSDVNVFDVATATTSRLSTEPGLNDRPEWTPDGKRVIYRHTPLAAGLREEIWLQPVDKSEAAVSFTKRFANLNFSEGALSPDGASMLIRSSGEKNGRDIWYVKVSVDTAPRPFEVTEFDELMPRFSPDGKWVAYISTESGEVAVYVRPFPGPGGRVQVSAGAGTEPVWSPDGHRIYYIAGRDLVAATVSAGTSFSVVKRDVLFSDDFVPGSIHANYDVSRDGKSFLMVQAQNQASTFTVAVNWLQDVKRRLAAQETGKAR